MEQPTTALEILLAEHRAIERELEILLEVAGAFERRSPVPLDTVDAVLDFFQQVADGVHHQKEEEELFPLLAERGVTPDESVIGALLLQHESGRFFVRQMRQDLERLRRGDRSAAEEFASAARAYVDLIHAHIQTEDECLYPVALRVLTPEDDRRLRAAFSAIGRFRRAEVV